MKYDESINVLIELINLNIGERYNEALKDGIEALKIVQAVDTVVEHWRDNEH